MARSTETDQTMTRRLMRAEYLDAESELGLARAWRTGRDEAALGRLVAAHMRLAVAAAMRFRRYGVPVQDLIQEAGLGLLKAADKFDPERGVRFSTYASWWVKAGLQDYVLRNWSMVRTGSTAGQKSLFFNLKRVQAKLERQAAQAGMVLDGPQLREKIAQEIGVTLRDVLMMEGRLSGSDQSLNAVQSSDGEGREWIDMLEDQAPQAADIVETTQDISRLRGWLRVAFRRLTERERYIVVARKIADPPRTLESLGQELGLSKERVRQLQVAASAKLRQSLEKQSPEVQQFLA